MTRRILASTCLVLAGLGCSSGPEDAVRDAYTAYRDALQERDLDRLRDLLAEDQAEDLESPEAAMALEMLAAMAPAASTVTGIEVSGGKAEIRVEGSLEGQAMAGTIDLVNEGGAWKVLHESWEISSSPGSGNWAEKIRTEAKPSRSLHWKAHDGAVTRIAFTPDGSQLVSVSYDDKGIRLWDRASGKLVAEAVSEHRPTDLAMFPDGTRIAVADAYGNVTLWPLDHDRLGEPRRLQGDAGKNPVRIAVNAKGTLLVTSAFQGPMYVWDVTRGGRGEDLPKSESIRGVAFSPRDDVVVGGGYGNTFTVWDLDGGRKEYRIPKVTEQSDAWAVAVSPDGKRVVTGHMDSSITVWDIARKKQIHDFYVQDQSTHAAAFSPDGTVIATAHQNGKVYLWDAETAIEVAILGPHQGAAKSVAFSDAEWDLLASGGEEGEIAIWR